MVFSKLFHLEETRNKNIAVDFCSEIHQLIASGNYDEETIIKTVDSILSDLSGKDENLKTAIKEELSSCYPSIKWNFKVDKKSQLIECK